VLNEKIIGVVKIEWMLN